jgi:hypothetical protein
MADDEATTKPTAPNGQRRRPRRAAEPRRTTRAQDGDPAPEFTDRDVNQIEKSLPDTVDPRKHDLLREVLRDGSSNDLREHMQIPRRASPERRARMVLIRDCARNLVRALNQADEVDRWGVADAMVRAVGLTLIAGRAELCVLNQRIEEAVSVLDKLAEAADETWKYGRGGPRNIVAYLIMMDIAAIFEWFTNSKASRETDRETGKEINAFYGFLAAIWPAIFHRGVYGLSSALKNWAEWSTEHRETSAVIHNIALRHPDWGT